MSITGQGRRAARKPFRGASAAHRIARPLAAAMLVAGRGAEMFKRIAILALAATIIAGAFPLGIASAQTTPPPAMSSLIAKLIAGLSADEQAAVITRNGGIETSQIPALRLHVVAVPTADLADTLARYQAD